MAGLLDTMPDPTPTSLQIFAIFIIIFFPALALVVVLIRVAGRLATSQFGWDDWLISMAMLLSVAETIISFFCELLVENNERGSKCKVADCNC